MTLDMFVLPEDPALEEVIAVLTAADEDGSRTARVLRSTFDQLYDGQHTGRYKVDQLHKTEKTHFGTLFEINFRREFDDVVDDGDKLDFKIAGHEVDAKYSFKMGGWMLPPESFGELLLVCTASDEASEWGLGVVRATADRRRAGANRDAKSGLTSYGLQQVSWLKWGQPLPPNVLLGTTQDDLAAIFSSRLSGQGRINELFRRVEGKRIGRNTIATVAQQDDFMKRVRYNGGARSALRPEGFILPGGDYFSHREIARQLGGPEPAAGEVISFRVVRAHETEPNIAHLDGRWWKRATTETAYDVAPLLPQTRKQ
jgi:hypothetical protein